MIERDYIMRMITMMTAVIMKVLRLKHAHDYPQALIELETASRSILGVPLPFLNGLSEDQLITLYHSDLNASAVKLHVAGMLLKEEADVLLLQGHTEEGTAHSAKALHLLVEALVSTGETLDDHHLEAIDGLWDRLRERELAPTLRVRLMKYCEWKGNFGKAEDLLYELIEEDERFTRDGVSFYERLLQRPDDVLEKGNLPREEVEQGLKRTRDRLRFVKIRHA
jgi:hypothetical protein